MTRPTSERLAEIRAWMRRQDDAQAPFPWRNDVRDLLAEIDALRAERDAAQRVAEGSRDLYARTMAAIHEAAGIRGDGVAGILGWIDEAREALDEARARAANRANP